MHDHPGVEVVCRDRDGVYARGATRGAPSAQQVADRWHLVHNLADALERFAVRSLADLARGVDSTRPLAAEPPPSAELLDAPASGRLVPRTEQRHAEVNELVTRGLSITAISRHLDLDRKTVRRFARASTPADLLRVDGQRPRKLDPFRAYLVQRWQEGAQVAAGLHRELQQRGYRGSRRSVQRFVADWQRSAPALPARRELPRPAHPGLAPPAPPIGARGRGSRPPPAALSQGSPHSSCPSAGPGISAPGPRSMRR